MLCYYCGWSFAAWWNIQLIFCKCNKALVMIFIRIFNIFHNTSDYGTHKLDRKWYKKIYRHSLHTYSTMYSMRKRGNCLDLNWEATDLSKKKIARQNASASYGVLCCWFYKTNFLSFEVVTYCTLLVVSMQQQLSLNCFT